MNVAKLLQREPLEMKPQNERRQHGLEESESMSVQLLHLLLRSTTNVSISHIPEKCFSTFLYFRYTVSWYICDISVGNPIWYELPASKYRVHDTNRITKCFSHHQFDPIPPYIEYPFKYINCKLTPNTTKPNSIHHTKKILPPVTTGSGARWKAPRAEKTKSAAANTQSQRSERKWTHRASTKIIKFDPQLYWLCMIDSPQWNVRIPNIVADT